jgi:MazG family protein
MGKIGKEFEELVKIISRLRQPDGCPWDYDQTSQSLIPFLIEETYELIESIDEKNWETVKEELGDVLLHIVFQASIADDNKQFKLEEVLKTVNEKLVKRHPHVFNIDQGVINNDLNKEWELSKHKEKGRESRLDGVPKDLPSIIKAQRLQQKASLAGFDWDKIELVWEKIHEEILELKEAEQQNNKDHIEEEIGDVLFSIVNLSRFLEISADNALRRTNRKFINRFKKVEKGIEGKGKVMEEATLEEMDIIWNQSKEKNNI